MFPVITGAAICYNRYFNRINYFSYGVHIVFIIRSLILGPGKGEYFQFSLPPFNTCNGTLRNFPNSAH